MCLCVYVLVLVCVYLNRFLVQLLVKLKGLSLIEKKHLLHWGGAGVGGGGGRAGRGGRGGRRGRLHQTMSPELGYLR